MAVENDMSTIDVSSSSSKEQLTGVRSLEGSLVIDPPKACIQQRYIVAFMTFLGNICCYSMRVNLSVAMVAMVNQTAIDGEDKANNSGGIECPLPLVGNGTGTDQDGEFVWSQTTQGIILGSFFWGYIFTQIPGGWLAQKWSGKWVYGIGILWTGLLTLLTPIAARWSIGALITVRVLEGLGEGVTLPAQQCLLTKWAPPLERTQINTLAFVGMHIGTVLSMPITGYICGSAWTGGWPSAFYLFGTLTALWFVLWAFLVSESPDDAKWITFEEKVYIQKSLGNTTNFKNTEKKETPWLDIFSSVHLWAILVAHVTSNWGFYTLLTTLPQYMTEVLHFNIKENAALSALPYLAFAIFGTSISFMADTIRRRGWMSTTIVRKIGNVLGLLLPGAFLIASGFVGCDRTVVVACVTLSVMFSSFTLCGFCVNHMDIAPRYTGILVGITNTAATIPGMLGPYVVGLLTNHEPTRGQWQKVFYIAGGIYAFGAIFYSVFGTGLRQNWNDKGELTLKAKQRLRTLNNSEPF